MFAAFKERRPWAAVVITIFFDPIIGMLYLGRWRYSLLYFAAENLSLVVAAMFLGADAFNPRTITPYIVVFGFRGAGAAQAYFTAKAASSQIRWYAKWYALIGFYLLLITPSLVADLLPYRSFHQISGSMAPTVNEGDYIIVAAYLDGAPKRGDVVVFDAPREVGVKYIKRIVGVSGDRIQFIKGTLYVNGAAARQRAAGSFQGNCSVLGGCEQIRRFVEILPDGNSHYIERIDDLNFVENTDVFTVPANSYFVAGDNRDNSRDSRLDEFGYVLRSAITGRVAIRYFDGPRRRWTWEKVD